MICEKCGGETYDNREKVAGGWKGPLFKCKDPTCDWRKWPPKASAAAKSSGRVARTWLELSQLYERSLRVAEKHVLPMAKRAGVVVGAADVLAAAATIFIAASRDGVKEKVATPEPAPAPPLNEPPPALATAEDDDSPF
jgi:hypothetical protein